MNNEKHNLNQLGSVYMVSAIKKPSFISSGRGYFLSDKSDKNTSLGIVPKTPYLLYSLKNYCILFHKNQTLITQTHLYFQKIPSLLVCPVKRVHIKTLLFFFYRTFALYTSSGLAANSLAAISFFI